MDRSRKGVQERDVYINYTLLENVRDLVTLIVDRTYCQFYCLKKYFSMYICECVEMCGKSNY